MTQRLILLRHGRRFPGADELHSESLHQIEDRAKFFSEYLGNLPVQFITSPKKRCIDTIGPIAEACGQSFSIDSLLEERTPAEDSLAFIGRVKNCLISFEPDEEGSESIFACSHSDWIFEAVRILLDVRVYLDEAGWCEFRREAKKWKLVEIVSQEQDFVDLKNNIKI